MSKREAILNAATELFARKGYNGTAASEIAVQAEVAQGTVFHHFKSKENLLISICDELVNDYVDGIKKAADGPGTGWEALERILKYNQEFKKTRYDSIAVAFRETRDLSKATGEVHDHFFNLVNQIIEVKSSCIERGIADGSIRPVPVQLTAHLIHVLLVGMIHVETEGLLEMPELDGELMEFCKRSLLSGN
jgi:AcrR family transcriptional regulator